MMRQEKGFTIVEVCIVIAVIGVLAAFAIPNFLNWLPKMRVNSAARDLVSEMQLTRMQAVSERNNYVITFNIGSNQYSIYDDDDNDFATAGAESGELVKTVNIGTDNPGVQFGYISGTQKPTGGSITTAVAFGSTSSPIRETFKPNGAASLSGSVYLIPTKDIAAGKTERQRAITVILTGRIKLWRYDGSSWS